MLGAGPRSSAVRPPSPKVKVKAGQGLRHEGPSRVALEGEHLPGRLLPLRAALVSQEWVLPGTSCFSRCVQGPRRVVKTGSGREAPRLTATCCLQPASVPLQSDPGPIPPGAGHLREHSRHGRAAPVLRRACGLWGRGPGPGPTGKATISQQRCAAGPSGHPAPTFAPTAALLGPRG